MLRNRFSPAASLLAISGLLLSACDSSSGSLISSDIKDLLDPKPQPDRTTETLADSTGVRTSDTTDSNAQTGDGTVIRGTNPLAPTVSSVSSTITIRGSDIVLLIQGSNLPDNLQVNLDNDPRACAVSQLLPTNSNSKLTNTLEAVCTTSAIVNRQVLVKNIAGDIIQGSPLNFSAENISVDSSTKTGNANASSDAASKPPISQTTLISTPPISGQENKPIAGLSELAKTFIETPSNITLLNAKASVRIAWNSVPSVDGYRIYISNSPSPQAGASGVTMYSSTQTNFELHDVIEGETYYLAVSAFFKNNESARSEDLVALVSAAPQSKYGAKFNISGNGESLALNGIVNGELSAKSMDQSDNGRYTVFLSNSDNLTATAFRGINQVFLHDKISNNITLISKSPSGKPANRDVSAPKISGDGSVVVFVSTATNLDTRVLASGNETQVFVTDTTTTSTSLASRSALISNRAANDNSYGAVINEDGSKLVFSSQADDLTTGTRTQSSHLYSLNVATLGITRLPTQRDSTPAGATATVDANALTADGKFLFYRLNIPGSSSSLHRIDMQELTQVTLKLNEDIHLNGAQIHSVSNDANLALIAYSNGTKTGLYSMTTRSLDVIGGRATNTKPKGLSGNGEIAVFWSAEDLLTSNTVEQSEQGNHYILNTSTGYLTETELNIQSISNDGFVVLYLTQPLAGIPAVQLQSIQP